MTDAEIIKALECCGVESGSCEKCPSKYRRRGDCIRLLTIDAINLINRQQAEINQFADIGKMYSEVRADVVREFAEAMKKELQNIAKVEIMGCEYYPIGLSFIDNLVSGMFPKGSDTE